MTFANQQTRQVTDFGIDPHNPAAAVVRDAWARLHAWLVPVTTGGDSDPERMFFGYQEGLQDFTRVAAPAATSSIYLDGSPELSDAVTTDNTMTDPVRRLLADQLKRRSAL